MIDPKARKDIANELRRALPLYKEQWDVYATYFEDAIKVVELGFSEWQRRFDEDL